MNYPERRRLGVFQCRLICFLTRFRLLSWTPSSVRFPVSTILFPIPLPLIALAITTKYKLTINLSELSNFPNHQNNRYQVLWDYSISIDTHSILTNIQSYIYPLLAVMIIIWFCCPNTYVENWKYLNEMYFIYNENILPSAFFA